MYAKVIADSIANDVRLTTLEVKFPRFILPEFLTHRMFSRNFRSNRFVSTETLLKEIYEFNYYCPTDLNELQNNRWESAVEEAAYQAGELHDMDVRKEVANRVLEPYQYTYGVVTATEWDNFFTLRLAKDAQLEIREIARLMKDALDSSNPKPVDDGLYHLPYINTNDPMMLSDAIKCSVARCARVSYKPFKMGSANIDKDIDLHDRLLRDKHMSPFEHVATPMEGNGRIVAAGGVKHYLNQPGVTHFDKHGYFWSGNFKSWIQYRHMI